MTTSSEKVIQVLKWFFFLGCLSAFLWKVFEGYLRMQKRDIGTKIVLDSNINYGLPGFAVCMPGNEIFQDLDSEGESLSFKFNLSTYDLLYLKSFKVIEENNQTYEKIFQDHLRKNWNIVHEISILSRSRYAFPEWPTFLAKAWPNQTGWRELFHPIFGYCFAFEEPRELVKIYVKEVGVKNVDVIVNQVEAYPEENPHYFPPPSTTTKTTTTTTMTSTSATNSTFHNADGFANITFVCPTCHHEGDFPLYSAPTQLINEYRDNQKNELLIMTYQPGSMFTTKETINSAPWQNSFLTLNQEFVDKRDIHDLTSCSDYENASEDDCLKECLVERFIKEFGCLHPRLAMLDVNVRERICRYKDLMDYQEIYTQNMKEHLARFGANFSENMYEFKDIGLLRLRDILEEFNTESVTEERCFCKIPCLKRYIDLKPFDEKYSDNETKTIVSFTFGSFVKVFSYHYLYTLQDFGADFGGYLGLFLGLSIFSLVEFALKTFAKRKREHQLEGSPKDNLNRCTEESDKLNPEDREI